MNFPVDVVAVPVKVDFTNALFPVNVGCDTSPLGVPVTKTLPDVPLNSEYNCIISPVNSGSDTVPLGVKLPVDVVAVPVKDADAPVITVLLVLDGTLPAENEKLKVSFETDADHEGAVPTEVMLYTVSVVGDTDTLPAGVPDTDTLPDVPVNVG